MIRKSKGTVYLRGAVWWIAYSWQGERYYEKASADQRVAKSLLAKRRKEGPEAPKAAPVSLTVERYLDRWTTGRQGRVRHADNEVAFFVRYVYPQIGSMVLGEVTRADMIALVETLERTVSEKTGKLLSARTVLAIYRTIQVAYSDAMTDLGLKSTPCTLKTRRNELPRKRDVSPTWRKEAVYTLAEIETLLSSPALPPDRRAFYGLMALAGCRSSEAAGLRWRDYDHAETPLGRLTVARQADGPRVERETKTGDTKEVAVHPVLAELLSHWRRVGFAQIFGRDPRPDDPIVPSRGDESGETFRGRSQSHRSLVGDLKRAGLRAVPSCQHAMRATFLTRLSADGAIMAIARRATHAAPKDVQGGYDRSGWLDLCREVAKLSITLRAPEGTTSLAAARVTRSVTNASIRYENSGPTWTRTRTRPVMSGEL